MRHPLDRYPRYALVVWPDARSDAAPSCIYLFSVDDAKAQGAVIVAREFEIVPVPTEGDDGA